MDATEKRFRAGGPDAIRLQEIAADVGISHPAILHHFGSRDGLIEALVVHGMQGLQAEILAGWSSEQVPDIAGVLERFYLVAEGRGYARLLAWLIFSRRDLRALAPGSLKPLVERMHTGRLRANLREGRPAPDLDDTLFLAVLFAITVFGDALFGPLLRRGAGLPEDAKTKRQFRVWLEGLITGRRSGPPRAGERR